MVKLLIIADDLTGAMDTGVQFSKHGIPTLVTMEYQLHSLAQQEAAQVLVVDTETRHLPAQEAYSRCYSLVKLAKALGISLFYKKTDSTLRGNVGAELSAVMDASQEDILYFAPAFPKQRRTCRNGKIYVDDMPLVQSIFAKDPFTPIASNSIAEIIRLQSDVPVTAIGHPESLPMLLSKKQIVVLDAEIDQDLQDICREVVGVQKAPLLAGSAGLAELLPMYMPFLHASEACKTSAVFGRKTLVICGSVNEISLRQVLVAEEAGYPSVLIESGAKHDPGFVTTAQGEAFCALIKQRLDDPGVVILKSLKCAEDLLQDNAHIHCGENRRQHIDIAMNIGRLARELIVRNRVDQLVVFGGDTLFGILCSQMNQYVRPTVEVLPGVVQSFISLSNQSICLLTKAGGFGQAATLLDILEEDTLLPQKNSNG